MVRTTIGVALLALGVLANNLVYLQDLWLGQTSITLDSWRAYSALLISIFIIALGGFLLLTAQRRR